MFNSGIDSLPAFVKGLNQHSVSDCDFIAFKSRRPSPGAFVHLSDGGAYRFLLSPLSAFYLLFASHSRGSSVMRRPCLSFLSHTINRCRAIEFLLVNLHAVLLGRKGAGSTVALIPPVLKDKNTFFFFFFFF